MNFYEFINRKELEEIRKIKAYTKKMNAQEGPFVLAGMEYACEDNIPGACT